MDMDSLICVGIITYNPDKGKLMRNLDAIISQCQDVVLIDNASKNIGDIVDIKSKYNINLITLNQNYGVAKALNVFMHFARENGYKWAMSLDQDSVVSKNIINEYKKYLELPDIAALCPQIRKFNSPKQGQDVLLKPVERIDRCPTTGFLCNVDKFFETEEYDEWMFIDYVDYDICMKIHLAGYLIYRVNTTFVLQDLGNTIVNERLVKLGRRLHCKKISNMGITFNHSPNRNYYYVRNALYYTKKYKDYINTRQEYWNILTWELKKVLLEKNRKETIKSIVRGYKDYKKKIRK